MHSAGKRGVNVVANIREALDHRELSHFPDPLPVNQWEKARIYKRGTPVGNVIRAALTVDGAKSDDVLRNIAGNTGNDIIQKIREPVCDEHDSDPTERGNTLSGPPPDGRRTAQSNAGLGAVGDILKLGLPLRRPPISHTFEDGLAQGRSAIILIPSSRDGRSFRPSFSFPDQLSAPAPIEQPQVRPPLASVGM